MFCITVNDFFCYFSAARSNNNRRIVTLRIISEGNGFVFSAYNAHEMLHAIRRACKGFEDKDGWNILVKRAMECDNSWGKSANEYIKMYKELLK